MVRVRKRGIRSLLLPSASALLLAAISLSGCTDLRAQRDPIVIGYLGSLSGRSAGLGLAARDGALLAVEQANAEGGINGRKIILKTADDGTGPTASADGLRALAATGALAVVGPQTSASASAAVPVADELGVPLVSPTVSSTDFTSQDDMFLRVCSDNKQYAEQLVQVCTQTHSTLRTAGILDMNNASYSRSLFGHFSDALVRHGGSITTTSTFASGEPTDYGSVARRAIEGNPDAVFVIANPIDSALFCQRLRAEGYRGNILLAHWAASGPKDLLESGGKSLDGVILLDNFDRRSTAPAYLAMTSAFEKRFGYKPGFAALHSYDSARLVIAAARDCPPGESMKAAILAQSNKSFPGTQGEFTLDANGDTVRRFYPTTIRGGEFRDLQTP